MKIPIFTFHKVGEARSKYWISKDALFHQTRTLCELGYQFTTMRDFCDGFIPEKPCIYTFDDAYQNFEEAFPILRHFGVKPTVFVPTGFVGKSNREWEKYDIVPVWHMHEEQIKSYSAVVDFQPHTVTHKHFGFISKEQQISELKESKDYMENLLGRECAVHCYVAGGYNEDIKKTVQECGYRMAVSCNHGVEDTETMDRFAVKRINNYSEIV